MNKIPEGHVAVGRLAIREEGALWNAYFAQPDTMEDAKLIGSILLRAVVEDSTIRQGFIDLMQAVTSLAFQEVTGESPTWGDPHTAPENERGGHA